MSFSDAGLTDPERFAAGIAAADGLAQTVVVLRAFLDHHLGGANNGFPRLPSGAAAVRFR